MFAIFFVDMQLACTINTYTGTHMYTLYIIRVVLCLLTGSAVLDKIPPRSCIGLSRDDEQQLDNGHSTRNTQLSRLT